GGATADERNIISGNDQTGVLIEGAGAERNVVIGNYIGSSADGLADLGNNTDGVRINSVGNNTIGGFGKGNLIPGNNSDGVEITGSTATNNHVLGNSIGQTAGGTALATAASGVSSTLNASNNMAGAAAATGRSIAFTGRDAIYVTSATN